MSKSAEENESLPDMGSKRKRASSLITSNVAPIRANMDDVETRDFIPPGDRLDLLAEEIGRQYDISDVCLEEIECKSKLAVLPFARKIASSHVSLTGRYCCLLCMTFDHNRMSFCLPGIEKDIFKPKVRIANKLNEKSISSSLRNHYRKAHAKIFAIQLGDIVDSFVDENLQQAAE